MEIRTGREKRKRNERGIKEEILAFTILSNVKIPNKISQEVTFNSSLHIMLG